MRTMHLLRDFTVCERLVADSKLIMVKLIMVQCHVYIYIFIYIYKYIYTYIYIQGVFVSV